MSARAIRKRSRAVSPEQLLAAISSGRGGVFHLVVLHDDECPQLCGGKCKCEPDYELRMDTRGCQ